jgi:hypothetical protein
MLAVMKMDVMFAPNILESALLASVLDGPGNASNRFETSV